VNRSAVDFAIPDDVKDQYSDFNWRIRNLYKIVNENGQTVTFTPNGSQELLLENLHFNNLILKARQLGFCVDPSTRVLMADLKWRSIGSLKAGDEVVAVDEEPLKPGKGQCRRMRTAKVQALRFRRTNAYQITFEDGRQVICSGEHRWLSKNQRNKVPGDWRSIESNSKKKLRVGSLVRWVTKPWGEPSFDDGWFGGILDGEGSMAKASTSGAEINVAQREGALWDAMNAYAENAGYNARVEIDNHPGRPSKHGGRAVHKLCFSRMDELFRLIGQTRPVRFADQRFWEGKEFPGKRSGIGWEKIVSIKPLGPRELVDMQTSTGTFIAEGFVSHNSTLVQLLMLDQCLWVPGMQVGMIAHRLDDAKRLFREKALFAYDHLPDLIKDHVPLVTRSATEAVFKNKSSFIVGTSLRSGTYRILHISEHGKLCAQFPEKAREVKTGALNTVPPKGMIFIESTAEGQSGDYYDFCQDAIALEKSGSPLTQQHYRFHFYPWFHCARYTLPLADAETVVIPEKFARYFESLEKNHGIELTIGQKAWYVLKAATQHEDMKREMPSFAKEAFEAVVEGAIFGDQIELANDDQRIGHKPPLPGFPVYTFWDIGIGDHTAIWLVQFLPNNMKRFIASYANHNLALPHYTNWLQTKAHELKITYRGHVLPHDGVNRDKITAEAYDLALKRLTGVPVLVMPATDPNLGINELRNQFPFFEFDEVQCADGLSAIKSYQWDRDEKADMNKRKPKHNWASHRADAMRTMAFFRQSLFQQSSRVAGGY